MVPALNVQHKNINTEIGVMQCTTLQVDQLSLQIDVSDGVGNKTVHRQDNLPTRFLKTVHRHFEDSSFIHMFFAKLPYGRKYNCQL